MVRKNYNLLHCFLRNFPRLDARNQTIKCRFEKRLEHASHVCLNVKDRNLCFRLVIFVSESVGGGGRKFWKLIVCTMGYPADCGQMKELCRVFMIVAVEVAAYAWPPQRWIEFGHTGDLLQPWKNNCKDQGSLKKMITCFFVLGEIILCFVCVCCSQSQMVVRWCWQSSLLPIYNSSAG